MSSQSAAHVTVPNGKSHNDPPGGYPQSDAASTTDSDAQYRSIAEAVNARKDEYTSPREIRVKVGTWNVASAKDTELDVGKWLTKTGPKPSSGGQSQTGPDEEAIDIYVLGLQEIVDLNSKAEALRPYTDTGPSNKFKIAVKQALPDDFELVSEQQLLGLLLLVYASSSTVSEIRSASSTSVGTGFMGYMGNKGAVLTELMLGEETRIVFINSHMSSGNTEADLQRRNWDAHQIVSRAAFHHEFGRSDIRHHRNTKVGDEDYTFWFGDLNYRIEGVPPEDVRKILTLHAQDEFNIYRGPKDTPRTVADAHLTGLNADSVMAKQDSEQLSSEIMKDLEETVDSGSDPTSLQATLDSLLPHDELRQQQKKGIMFHDGWKEGPIRFLPTYKYDVGRVAAFDSSEKRRGPSWCDRILYRSRTAKQEYEQHVLEQEASRKRDALLASEGVDKAANDEDEMLFEYDPEMDGDAEEMDRPAEEDVENNISRIPTSQSSRRDGLSLEFYDCAQHIVSSDHKPLVAIFTLVYNATIPALKTRVQEEVAREFDKAENENRPTLTVVADEKLASDGPGNEGVDFGEIRYLERLSRALTVANTGSTAAVFGFANHPGRYETKSRPTPPWLELYTSSQPSWSHKTHHEAKRARAELGNWIDEVPEAFILSPGETCDFEMRIELHEQEYIRKLNSGTVILDDTLVARVKGGRDFFVPVRASWLRTSHGMTIDELVQVPEGGVRGLQHNPSNKDPSKGDLGPRESAMWSAPREIFRLTTALENLVERIIAEWNMLSAEAEGESIPPWQAHPGWPFTQESWSLDAEKLRAASIDANEALDTDQLFEKTILIEMPALYRLQTLASTLLTFLKNLADGVIPAPLWAQVHQHLAKSSRASKTASADSVERERQAILEILSTSRNHSITFVLITTMLSRIALEIKTGSPPPATSKPMSRLSLSLAPAIAIRSHAAAKTPLEASSNLLKDYVNIFADVLIRTNSGNERSSKASHSDQLERRKLLALFLGVDTS